MRIAALSDIHGNLAALEAVLADARGAGADLVVNLGDILSGPLHPAETADLLIDLALPTIAGNHERQLLTHAPERLGESDAFTLPRLTPRHRDWLATLPQTLDLPGGAFACHGNPASDLGEFLESVTPAGARPATPAEVAERAGDRCAGLILCGHTHVQRHLRLADCRLVLNPGSVGLPAYAEDLPYPHRMEMGTPHARYALATLAGGTWHAELRAVAYDWDAAAALAAANGRPDWARALATGLA